MPAAWRATSLLLQSLAIALCGLRFAFAEPAPLGDDPLAPAQRPVEEIGAAGVGPAWITDGLVKVHPNQGRGAARPLILAGARNEFVSFQVHVRAGARPLRLNVIVGDFVNAAANARIDRAAAITVYREAYLDITQLSDLNGARGLTPDPLIPTVDPYLHEARRAFPVDVPADTTQSAWVDVLVPHTAPAGYYQGKVTVRDGATTLATLTPVIKVWGFAIPSTASLKSAFGMEWDGLCVAAYGSYDNCSKYPGSQGSNDRAVDLTHVAEATFALDHRVTIDTAVTLGPPIVAWAHDDPLFGPLLDGTAKTLLKGAALTTSQFIYSSAPTAAGVRNWVAHYKAKGWLPKLFDYTCDEPPNGCSWSDLATRAERIRAGSTLMPTLVTTSIDSARSHGVLDLIDILVVIVEQMEPKGGADQRAKYDAWLKLPHKRLWWYQSCDEHESCSNGTPGGKTSTWPSYMVDATPVRNRIFQWLAYLDRIEGELYYQIDYCWAPGACPSGDPWVSVYAFGGNGDGTLIYPGATKRIGGTTPIPLPSVRFKLIRDGMQDFELLNALDKAGEGAFARSVARRFITNATTFDNDPAAMAAAHEALGDRLHKLALGR